MTRRFTVALLAALALALGACGEDSGGEGQAASGATSEEEAGATGATGGAATTEPGAPDGGGGEAPKLDPDNNREPVPEGSVPPEDRTGSPPRYTRENPIPKEQLKAVERPIFEQSQYLCKRLGIEGMRREYRIGSSDPQDVAREVARRTYLREARDAVYSGCLAGLRSGE
ncbi:MAG: hypothetical protein ACRDLQ_11180 [Solirubrobacterales bacterium]